MGGHRKQIARHPVACVGRLVVDMSKGDMGHCLDRWGHLLCYHGGQHLVRGGSALRSTMAVRLFGGTEATYNPPPECSSVRRPVAGPFSNASDRSNQSSAKGNHRGQGRVFDQVERGTPGIFNHQNGTGPLIWPLTALATSTAPAFLELNPTFFISGIHPVPVSAPVKTSNGRTTGTTMRSTSRHLCMLQKMRPGKSGSC